MSIEDVDEVSSDVFYTFWVNAKRVKPNKVKAYLSGVGRNKAKLALPYPDREIFLRHYYYCQSLKTISQEMDINISTIKTKLHRGRKKLKEIIIKGGNYEKNKILKIVHFANILFYVKCI